MVCQNIPSLESCGVVSTSNYRHNFSHSQPDSIGTLKSYLHYGIFNFTAGLPKSIGQANDDNFYSLGSYSQQRHSHCQENIGAWYVKRFLHVDQRGRRLCAHAIEARKHLYDSAKFPNHILYSTIRSCLA